MSSPGRMAVGGLLPLPDRPPTCSPPWRQRWPAPGGAWAAAGPPHGLRTQPAGTPPRRAPLPASAPRAACCAAWRRGRAGACSVESGQFAQHRCGGGAGGGGLGPLCPRPQLAAWPGAWVLQHAGAGRGKWVWPQTQRGGRCLVPSRRASPSTPAPPRAPDQCVCTLHSGASAWQKVRAQVLCWSAPAGPVHAPTSPMGRARGQPVVCGLQALCARTALGRCVQPNVCAAPRKRAPPRAPTCTVVRRRAPTQASCLPRSHTWPAP